MMIHLHARVHKSYSTLFFVIALLLGTVNLEAQSWDEVVSNPQEWLFGVGRGSTKEKAKKEALVDLTGKISTVVISTFDHIEDEKIDDGDIEYSSYIQSKVSTYSQAMLTNTEHFEELDGDEWQALCFVKRSEVDTIFKGRKDKVMELVRLGDAAVSQYKVGDALKYYYWAFTLLKTLQYPNQLKYTDKNGIEHLLVTYLLHQMDDIFDDIRVFVTNIDNNYAELYFTFRNHPVVNMEYSCCIGSNCSNLYSVKDGRGEVEFVMNYVPDYLQVMVEYAYQQDAKVYCHEVWDVLEEESNLA